MEEGKNREKIERKSRKKSIDYMTGRRRSNRGKTVNSRHKEFFGVHCVTELFAEKKNSAHFQFATDAFINRIRHNTNIKVL